MDTRFLLIKEYQQASPACPITVKLTIIKPIPEFVEAMLDQVLGGTEIEPRIELVDDTFESNDGEETTGNGSSGNGTQDDDSEKASRVPSGIPLEKGINWGCDGHDGGREKE